MRNNLDNYELFIDTFIGEIWDNIPPIKKMIILKKLKEIQETVESNTFS